MECLTSDEAEMIKSLKEIVVVVLNPALIRKYEQLIAFT